MTPSSARRSGIEGRDAPPDGFDGTVPLRRVFFVRFGTSTPDQPARSRDFAASLQDVREILQWRCEFAGMGLRVLARLLRALRSHSAGSLGLRRLGGINLLSFPKSRSDYYRPELR